MQSYRSWQSGVFSSLQIVEEENIEVDSKFRALVAIGSLVYLILSM